MLYDKRWDAKVDTKIEPWRKALFDAADLVRVRGLAKGMQQAPDGSVCLHGALSIAISRTPYADGSTYCDASLAVVAVLRRRGVPYYQPTHITGAAVWNNAPERTAEEVIEVLEAAANGS